ncbi:hypothetical protein [Rhizobium tumorigenes]|uniref:Uncharacterized protein n=1 Tax=Rhizobium tumorigenes TaxID=2041385 RepID=A0AAF1KME4_9HYPH|nr:hypothetical protein [Rhizobium tumorigenes]WFR97848.1 hypothetical protein PR017_18225 [Rhizobium tumorigenes]WFS03407.1 hypothetical protein PR016_19095 [Rhizobium tumorigenes]
MIEKSITWEQDGIDSGWLFAKDVGSVQSNVSYRSGGWWPGEMAARYRGA